MKRMVFFAVSALAAILLAAPAASAQPARQGPICITEALWLYGTNGTATAICMGTQNPSITPRFTAYSESNGSQDDWCLYAQPNYGWLVARIPAFSGARIGVTVGSARPC